MIILFRVQKIAFHYVNDAKEIRITYKKPYQHPTNSYRGRSW